VRVAIGADRGMAAAVNRLPRSGIPILFHLPQRLTAMRLPQLSLHRFQTRLLLAFVLVMVAVGVTSLFLIHVTAVVAARKTVSAEVVAGARTFERLLELDSQRLIEGARLLSSDSAFKEAAAGADRASLGPALAKHGNRIGSAVTLLVDGDRRIVAGTLAGEIGKRFAHSKLLDRASAAQQATALVSYGGQLYQLVVVPVLAPQPIAWIAAGIRVDAAMVTELKSLTRLDISFLSRPEDGAWQMRASTLEEGAKSDLTRDFGANRYATAGSDGNAEFGDDIITRVINLAPRADDGAVAVLQGSLPVALESIRTIEERQALVLLVGLVATVLVGLLLARGVAEPARAIAAAARRVAAGDYTPIADPSRKDEIADLAVAFRSMQAAVSANVSRMTELAHRDQLTGLPTRVLFADRLDQAIASGSRAGTPVAVLILNLDHVGHVNETLGHPIGDMLLREVAARLRSVVRRASDSVARIGGDEFAILMAGSRVSDAQRVAEAVIRALEVRMTLDGHVVDVHASIGVAVCPDHGHDPGKLLQRADVAMRTGKRDKMRIVMWDDRYDENGEKRLALMSDLKKAVDNEELALIYQPQVALGDSGEHFVEALVRWQHPTRGLVPPSEFVPLAEQTGYIRTITQWVLSHAVTQCAEWRNRGLPMNVSVNISAADLLNSDLTAQLEQMFEKEGCSAQWLTLEITENTIVGEPGHALKNLERLHDLGCKLALDDYGTGYSSLAYLRRLPLDELKIDKSCTMGMATDASDALIVRSTIELAHKLGLTVVATGVEDEGTLNQLRELRCDAVQGFLVSRPLAPDDVAAWVRESPWTRPARERTSLRRVS
jgi:diguanylate cyclase (GGDEF)-like protein